MKYKLALNTCETKVNRVLDISLELDNDSLESEISKSVRGLDHSLFRYNVLFEDSLNTPNRPSSENDGIVCLGSYSIYANPLWCDNIPPKDGNLFLEDESTLKGKECVVLETTSSSTLCGFSEDTKVEVELSATFLYSLFTSNDMYANVESKSCGCGKDYGKWSSQQLGKTDGKDLVADKRNLKDKNMPIAEAKIDDPEKELKPSVDIIRDTDEMFYENYDKFVHSCVNNEFYWVQVLSLSSNNDLLSTFIFISAVVVVSSLGEGVDEEKASWADGSIINQALLVLPVLNNSGKQEHQSENVVERKIILCMFLHNHCNCLVSNIGLVIIHGMTKMLRKVSAQSWADLVDEEDEQKNEPKLVASRFSPTTVDLSKDVLDEEEEDIDLGEDSFDKDEEENMLVICFDIVSKGGDISPRHRRSGSNKKKKMTHGRQHS
ncbi:hypothetical protein BC332_28957 [Capsicum chinense]|nr:hypothetical protein BC332_28957 [Capsicum chinense]